MAVTTSLWVGSRDVLTSGSVATQIDAPVEILVSYEGEAVEVEFIFQITSEQEISRLKADLAPATRYPGNKLRFTLAMEGAWSHLSVNKPINIGVIRGRRLSVNFVCVMTSDRSVLMGYTLMLGEVASG
jgi:hypothetical protein